MSKVNLETLNRFKKQVQDSKKGNGSVLEVRKIESNTEIDIRMQLPHENQKGNPIIQTTTYWINQKPYLSPSFLGRECPIAQEIDEAKATGRKDLKEMLVPNSKKGSAFSISTEYLLPVRMVEHKDNGTLFIDPDKEILKVGSSNLIEDIIGIMTNPKLLKQAKEGIFDKENGFAVTVKKTGTGVDTKYSAVVDGVTGAFAMPDGLFDKPADILGYLEGQLKSDEELTEAIREYLYSAENKPTSEATKKVKKASSIEDELDDN
jgi:hypothetical protein